MHKLRTILFVAACTVGISGHCLAQPSTTIAQEGTRVQTLPAEVETLLAACGPGKIMQLTPANGCPITAYAVHISVGPPGALRPDTLKTPYEGQGGDQEIRFVSNSNYRQRVVINTCERTNWLVIQDIRTGRADTRSVVASFKVVDNDLWKLEREIVHLGPLLKYSTKRDSIIWFSPEIFMWHLYGDTIVFERLVEGRYRVYRLANTN